jgi:hypothetical protein
MNRRQFLASFAAAIAVHKLPKVLIVGQPSIPILSQCTNAYDAKSAVEYANGGEALWVMLYELDPFMRVTMDHKNFGFHIYSDYDRDMIRRVLWNYKPLGVMATINGELVTFEDFVAASNGYTTYAVNWKA